IPRALILAPQRRSMVSSMPTTTGPCGTRAATRSSRSRCATAREDQPPILRVHPGSFAGLTELLQHEADGREAQECERLAVQAFPILSQSTASVEPCDGPFDNPALRQDDEALGLIGPL